MERSSEIGVRKAFGASSRTLVWQFIVENIILTLIGAVIGFGAFIYYYSSNKQQRSDSKHSSYHKLYCVVICIDCMSCFWIAFRCISCMAYVADCMW